MIRSKDLDIDDSGVCSKTGSLKKESSVAISNDVSSVLVLILEENRELLVCLDELYHE